MKKMRGSDGIKSAVAEAEAAVVEVKDAKLKVAAFQKVLEHLLSPNRSAAKASLARKEKASLSHRTAAEKARLGPQARLEGLVAEEFFTKPQTLAGVRAELANRGFHIPLTSLSGPLQILCRRKILRRQHVTAEGRTVFAYSVW